LHPQTSSYLLWSKSSIDCRIDIQETHSGKRRPEVALITPAVRFVSLAELSF
jgi:hypothetical protein